MEKKKKKRGTELEEEAWNKGSHLRKDGWIWADIKKFGWRAKRKKRRKYGYDNTVVRWWFVRRKNERKFIKHINHCILFHIPLTIEEIEEVKWYDGLLYHEALKFYSSLITL